MQIWEMELQHTQASCLFYSGVSWCPCNPGDHNACCTQVVCGGSCLASLEIVWWWISLCQPSTKAPGRAGKKTQIMCQDSMLSFLSYSDLYVCLFPFVFHSTVKSMILPGTWKTHWPKDSAEQVSFNLTQANLQETDNFGISPCFEIENMEPWGLEHVEASYLLSWFLYRKGN